MTLVQGEVPVCDLAPPFPRYRCFPPGVMIIGDSDDDATSLITHMYDRKADIITRCGFAPLFCGIGATSSYIGSKPR
jgi:hypothetical protein